MKINKCLSILLCSSFALNNRNLCVLKANYMEGDLSGDYQLSGLWKLYIEPVSTQPSLENMNQISWSGNIWNSHNRKRFYSKYINLNKFGTFSEAYDKKTQNIFHGIWYCDNNELVMTRKRYGYSSYETYYGIYDPKNNGRIYGCFVYGATEPEYSGIFIMKNLMTRFNPLLKNTKLEIDTLVTNNILGKWRMDYETDISYSSFNIELYSNLTWESIDCEYKLIGNWNLYNDTIDLTTGLNGTGNRLWLWLRRFHKGYSGQNNHLEQDRLYTGVIRLTGDKKIKNIFGEVCIGWNIEPAFIGHFSLKKLF